METDIPAANLENDPEKGMITAHNYIRAKIEHGNRTL
jgi:hypothetical protein